MPSDANGVHSLPNGYLAEDGDTIQPSQHNPPLEDLSAGLTERLMRSGVAPMTGPLKLADGNVGAPGMSFNSDPSAGFYLEGGKIKFTKQIVGVLPVGLGPLPWSRMTAPAGWVLCYGQTLLRASYPELWTVAQAEISAGNPMYNNGDGSTTFGILDMRGLVAAGYDAIGGASAGRLPGAFGLRQGAYQFTLAPAELPAVSLSLVGTATGAVTVNSTVADIIRNGGGIGAAQINSGSGGFVPISNNSGYVASAIQSSGSANLAVTGTTTNLGGGQPHNNVQPTTPMNMMIYAGA